MRKYRATVGGTPLQLLRGEFHRHTEMSGDGGRDGPVIDAYRYMIDAAAMDWGGCCDHDNGGGREYSWWIQQKLTDAYKLGASLRPHVLLRAQREISRRPSQRGIRAARNPPAAAPAQDGRRFACHARARYADALPLPAAVPRHRGFPHLRHRHGHGLARQRPHRRAGGRDLPGRPPELRDARRSALADRAARNTWASFRWR